MVQFLADSRVSDPVAQGIVSEEQDLESTESSLLE
jgi:hypothetical protein